MTDRNSDPTDVRSGGPAFPASRDVDYGYTVTDPGMSLRDWFAGQVLAGVFVNVSGLGTVGDAERRGLLAGVSAICYEAADAMLAAREED